MRARGQRRPRDSACGWIGGEREGEEEGVHEEVDSGEHEDGGEVGLDEEEPVDLPRRGGVDELKRRKRKRRGSGGEEDLGGDEDHEDHVDELEAGHDPMRGSGPDGEGGREERERREIYQERHSKSSTRMTLSAWKRMEKSRIVRVITLLSNTARNRLGALGYEGGEGEEREEERDLDRLLLLLADDLLLELGEAVGQVLQRLERLLNLFLHLLDRGQDRLRVLVRQVAARPLLVVRRGRGGGRGGGGREASKRAGSRKERWRKREGLRGERNSRHDQPPQRPRGGRRRLD